MFFAERIKQWLRPRPPGTDAPPKQEVEVLSAKVEIGEDGVPGRMEMYLLTLLYMELQELDEIQPQNAHDFSQFLVPFVIPPCISLMSVEEINLAA